MILCRQNNPFDEVLDKGNLKGSNVLRKSINYNFQIIY